MADFEEAFNSGKIQNIINYDQYNDKIDYFFTQRKVIEYDEYIDEQKMTREKKKKDVVYNFISINIPYYLYIDDKDNQISVDVKIWGDQNLKYMGNIRCTEGNVPNILLKLQTDKQLFVNLKISIFEESKSNEKEYVTFINIPKRYHSDPNKYSDLVLEKV